MCVERNYVRGGGRQTTRSPAAPGLPVRLSWRRPRAYLCRRVRRRNRRLPGPARPLRMPAGIRPGVVLSTPFSIALRTRPCLVDLLPSVSPVAGPGAPAARRGRARSCRRCPPRRACGRCRSWSGRASWPALRLAGTSCATPVSRRRPSGRRARGSAPQRTASAGRR